MIIRVTGRNKFELYLLVFWTVGWPCLLFWIANKFELEYILPEGLLIALSIILYLCFLPLHFFFMDIYFKIQFNLNHKVNLSLKEYRYVKKHLFFIPKDEEIQKYSKDVKKSIYIYMAYEKDKKKKQKPFISKAITILKINNII